MRAELDLARGGGLAGAEGAPGRERGESGWRVAGNYFLALVLCCVLGWWFLDVGRNSLRVPFFFDGDFLLPMAFAKGMMAHGGFLRNGDLGAPFGQQLYDYPMPEAVHYFFIRVIGWVVPRWVQVIDVFYLLTFPLTTLTTLFALRQLRFHWGLGLAGSLLYTFLPYHFMRIGHVMLAAYYLVPLSCVVILLVATGKPVFFVGGEGWRARVGRGWRRMVMGFVICVLTGMGGIYYACFTLLFLVAAAPMGVVRRRNWGPGLDAGVLCVLICGAIGVNLAPNIWDHLREGGNHVVASRGSGESETYGLKVTQLLLPRPGHRIAAWGHKGATMDTHPLTNENATATLGAELSVGFIALMLVVGFGLAGVKFRPLLVAAGVLNLFGVLWATVGGFGAVFAMLVSPELRGLNRISVFVAFFSLIGFLILLERPFLAGMRMRWGKVVAGAGLGVVVWVGLLDMVLPVYALNVVAAAPGYYREAAYVGRLEKILPAGAMVFQLPYMAFPENGAMWELGDYSELKPYLVSRQLRFSYGAMAGRAGAEWEKKVAGEKVAEMVETLVGAGFSGVLIEARGYPGRRSPEREFEEVLREKPVVNEKGDAFFFDVRGGKGK